jgi:hypothetical protein
MPNIHAKYMIRWGVDDLKTELKLFWNDEISSSMWDSPNLVDTEMKFHGGRGKKYAAQKKRHLLDAALNDQYKLLHGAYNGKKKPSLVVQFQPYDFGSKHTPIITRLSLTESSRIIQSEQASLDEWLSLLTQEKTVYIPRPRFGWQAVISGVVINLYENESGYHAVAHHSQKRIASASGRTRHDCLHHLFHQPVWYYHRSALSWVGLDWLYKTIHIRFPLSRVPFPTNSVYTLSLQHVKGMGYLRWEQLKKR